MRGINFFLTALSCFQVIFTTALRQRDLPAFDLSGCGKNQTLGYTDVGVNTTIKSNGQDRYYGIYVPQSYNDDTNKPRKLIFDYHGGSDTPRKQYNNSQYFKYPRGEEYLVVYPQSLVFAGYWLVESGGGTQRDFDLQFTTDLLAHIRQNYCVDSYHVYASGKSEGGGFCDYLACSSNGSDFSAYAMASAALYTDNNLTDCNRSRAILESHGRLDDVAKYNGTGSGTRHGGGHLPNIDQWIGWWADRDGFGINNNTAFVNKTVSINVGYNTTTFTRDGQDYVKHYDVFNLGHCWPSSSRDNTDGVRSVCSDTSLDFTPKVLNFFCEWDLKLAPNKTVGLGMSG